MLDMSSKAVLSAALELVPCPCHLWLADYELAILRWVMLQTDKQPDFAQDVDPVRYSDKAGNSSLWTDYPFHHNSVDRPCQICLFLCPNPFLRVDNFEAL